MSVPEQAVIKLYSAEVYYFNIGGCKVLYFCMIPFLLCEEEGKKLMRIN